MIKFTRRQKIPELKKIIGQFLPTGDPDNLQANQQNREEVFLSLIYPKIEILIERQK